MNKKLITFTLDNGSSEDYNKIHKKIKSIASSWAKIDETLYLVITEMSSVNLREFIKNTTLQSSFKNIFVVQWEHPSAWSGLSEEVSNWLQNN